MTPTRSGRSGGDDGVVRRRGCWSPRERAQRRVTKLYSSHGRRMRSYARHAPRSAPPRSASASALLDHRRQVAQSCRSRRRMPGRASKTKSDEEVTSAAPSAQRTPRTRRRGRRAVSRGTDSAQARRRYAHEAAAFTTAHGLELVEREATEGGSAMSISRARRELVGMPASRGAGEARLGCRRPVMRSYAFYPAPSLRP